MNVRNKFCRALLATLIAMVLVGVSHANVWMDENFDGTSQFVQGNGAGTPPDATLDVYSTNPLTNQVGSVLTNTGAVVSTKFFNGANSYQIETGETLAVAEPYQDQTNGNFQVFQFAVNVDPIPAAGTVGEFRWNFDSDSGTAPSIDHSYYIRLVSTGSAVNIIAGEDVANTPTPDELNIGTLNSTSDWAYLSLIMQKNDVATADSRTQLNGLGSVAQGLHFFNSSAAEAHSIGFLGATAPAFVSRNWSFTVSSGTVYIDDIYWDGGLEDDNVNSNVRPLSSSVPDWQLID